MHNDSDWWSHWLSMEELSSGRFSRIRIASSRAGPSFRTAERWEPSERSESLPAAPASGPSFDAILCTIRPGSVTVYEFDQDGNVLKSFGGGMFIWPHGLDVDRDGNVWITDAVAANRTPKGDKRGQQVVKFSPDGKVLMTLGTPGVAGGGPDHFNSPSDIAVAPNGDIFVADGHVDNGNNRVVKFSKDGKFIKDWGKTGWAPGEFHTLHAIAIDSRGRVFVGDRGNNRIQIFDQEGKSLATWTQFGKPSGIFFDNKD